MKLILKSLLAIFMTSLAVAQTDNRVITLSKSNHGAEDKYFGSYYDKGGVGNGPTLVTGGWGDVYAFLVKWDALKFPKVASKVWLGLDRVDYNTNTTDMFYYAMATPWRENDGVLMFTYGMSAYSFQTSSTSPALFRFSAPIGAGGSTTYLDITDMYNAILSNPLKNQGVLVMPKYNDNRFNRFYSSESSRPPKLVITVPPPTLKLPLPGGKRWNATVQPGGLVFGGGVDTGHQKEAFYSIDFSGARYKDASGNLKDASNEYIPVLAAASGTIVKCEFDGVYGAGNLVKIDHDGDYNQTTGCQTSYFHMEDLFYGSYSDSPPFKVGQYVQQGQVIGWVGDTGFNSKGKHLHFEIRFQNKGSGQETVGDSPYLNKLTVEGIPITSFRFGEFYNSTNLNIPTIPR